MTLSYEMLQRRMLVMGGDFSGLILYAHVIWWDDFNELLRKL